MNIGIVGLGLIGGSIGRALVKMGKHRVYARDISEQAMLEGMLVGAYNNELKDDILKELDLLIVALPPIATIDTLNVLSDKLKPAAIVIDTCGDKRTIATTMEILSKKHQAINYIGCHPMAGREFSGVSYSKAELFCGASIILTPLRADIESIEIIKNLFIEMGAEGVVLTTPENHDKMIAYTSQLAHIVSNAYVKSPRALFHHGYSAGSYKDMTRVARLNSPMWTELMLSNRDNLVEELDIFIDNIKKYRDALNSEDKEKLNDLLDDGNNRKVKIDRGDSDEDN